jgi:hypothetical protein
VERPLSLHCPVAVGLEVDDAMIVEEGPLANVDVVPAEEPDAGPVDVGEGAAEPVAELEPPLTKLATGGPGNVY